MDVTLHESSVAGFENPGDATPPMAEAFIAAVPSHDVLLFAEVDRVSSALMRGYDASGLIDLVALAACLYDVGWDVAKDYPKDKAQKRRGARVLAEGLARLVRKGHVAYDPVGREWFVTRAGAAAHPTPWPGSGRSA